MIKFFILFGSLNIVLAFINSNKSKKERKSLENLTKLYLINSWISILIIVALIIIMIFK